MTGRRSARADGRRCRGLRRGGRRQCVGTAGHHRLCGADHDGDDPGGGNDSGNNDRGDVCGDE